jgi:iron complex outermembrane receptor protein
MNSSLRTRLGSARWIFHAVAFALPLFVQAQTAPALKPTSSSSTTSSSGDETVQLKEFVVSDSADLGYSTPNAIGLTRSNEALIDTPQTINVLNQQFLQDFNPVELADVYQYVAGVTIESNVGDSTMIRGYTVRDQFTDGMVDNQNQSQMGAEPYQYERIEVLKGPAGLVYGSTAIGGLTNRVRKAPNWRRRGEIAFTFGDYNQTKTEFDYNTPLGKRVAVRLIATYRDDDLVNGVHTRFSYQNRWNINPSMLVKLNAKSQLRFFGEFLEEKAHKHWGENGMFATVTVPTQRTVAAATNFARLGEREAQFGLTHDQGGITTWGLLPRDFTFSEQQAMGKNIKQAGGAFYEGKIGDDLLLRAGGQISFWDHFVEDVIPVGMAGNNHEMTRIWRTIENVDRYSVAAIDATYSFNLLGSRHKLFAVNQYQYRNLFQRIYSMNPARPIQNIDLFNPVYTGYDPFDKVRTNQQRGHAPNYAFGFKDHIKFLGDKLQVAGGPRYDWYKSRTNNEINGVPGTLSKGKNWTYNYGAVLKPNKTYSFFFGHSETYAPNTAVNPDRTTFSPQIGSVNEFGIKMAFLDGRIAGTISTYKLRLEHIILNDPDPVRAAAGWRVDSGFQETKGYEADVYFQITRSWQLNLGGSDIDVQTPNGIFPRGSAKKTANFATSYRFTQGKLKGLAFGAGGAYKGPFNVETPALTDRIARYYLPSYATANGWVSYAWQKYRFQLNVTNLTDEWYLLRSVSKEQILQGPVRSWRFRIVRSF